MKSKQLILLLVAAVILGGGGLWVTSRRSASFEQSRASMGSSLLGAFDGGKVSAVRIQQGSNTVNMVRVGTDWVVSERGNFPANVADLGSFLQKLDGLKVARPVNVGPSRLPMLDLSAPQVTVVELLGEDGKALKTLRLGKQSTKNGGGDDMMGGGGYPDGRYVQVGEAVSLVGDPLSNARPSPGEWIAKEFVKVEQPLSVRITHADSTNNFTLVRTNEFAEWTLVEPAAGETLDKNKASSFSSLLGSASFNDIILNPDLAALGLDHPTTAQITTSGGFTYDIKVGAADGENYPVQLTVAAELPTERAAGVDEKAEDKERLDKEFKEKQAKQQQKLKSEQALGQWTFTMSKWTVEPLLKKRSEILAAPAGTPGLTPPDDDAHGDPAGFPLTLPGLPGDQ